MKWKANTSGLLGLFCAMGVLANWQYLFDWSTAEMVGRNGFTVLCLVGAPLLLRYAFKNGA